LKEIISSTYDFEYEIVKNIRLKNLEEAFSLYDRYFSPSNISSMGDTYTRSLKNNLICTIYYIGRTLCPKHCFDLKEISSLYISRVESAHSVESICKIGKESILKFSEFLSFHPVRCSNRLIFETIKYIEENLESELTLEVLSERVHISKNYLSSIFIKHTGIKLTSFINASRISRSKELLKSTDYSLGYISDLCGFKNQNYFSTVFKKLEDKTPLEYRLDQN
jgi:YesN/AraC family two-component response regulator